MSCMEVLSILVQDVKKKKKKKKKKKRIILFNCNALIQNL